MQMTDTVCFKVDESLKLIEDAMQSNTLDAPKLASLLHEIRRDAQRMENGLKARRQQMIAFGIEETYQMRKTDNEKPKGLNKVANTYEETNAVPDYEFIVKKAGEVVYQNKAHAGVVSVVERINDMDGEGFIDGQTQKFVFGHTIAFWFAFDQLTKEMEAKKIEIAVAMRAMLTGTRKERRENKRKLLKGAQKMNV